MKDNFKSEIEVGQVGKFERKTLKNLLLEQPILKLQVFRKFEYVQNLNWANWAKKGSLHSRTKVSFFNIRNMQSAGGKFVSKFHLPKNGLFEGIPSRRQKER